MVERRPSSTTIRELLDEEGLWRTLLERQNKPFQLLAALIKFTDQFSTISEDEVVYRPTGLTAILGFITGVRKTLPYPESDVRKIIGSSLKVGSGLSSSDVDLWSVPLIHLDYKRLVEEVRAAKLPEIKRIKRKPKPKKTEEELNA